MLKELYVENFALIEKMRLSFAEGLWALTGETGAGKSLVIDAVSLLIGGRAKESFIRSGEEKCVIEGVFEPPYPQELPLLLEASGIQSDQEEKILIFRREISRGGKSICRINGMTVTLALFRQAGRLLVNINGQMEHLLLLEEEKQLSLLDSFGGDKVSSLSEQVRNSYSLMQHWQNKYREYEEKQQERAQRIDWLRFQIEEIEQSKLLPDEEERLKTEAELLSHGEKRLNASAAANNALSGNGGAIDKSAQAMEAMRQISSLDKEAIPLYERLCAAYYELEDIAQEVQRYAGDIVNDPLHLEEIESRLFLIGRLKKKYGGSIPEILSYFQKAQEELASLEEWDLIGDTAALQLGKEKEQYDALAASLTDIRKETARKLGAAITEELKLLYMPNAVFRVDLNTHAPSAHGNESVVFMIQSNLGEVFCPVAKIASGGELARIVLGIKVILAQLDAVPTLIFDETDTGIGGRALSAVANRIKMIAAYTQSICVTHAPLMAAAANKQIHIYKKIEGKRTVIQAQELDYEGRINELARMLAGDKVSEATLSQARELLS